MKPLFIVLLVLVAISFTCCDSKVKSIKGEKPTVQTDQLEKTTVQIDQVEKPSDPPITAQEEMESLFKEIRSKADKGNYTDAVFHLHKFIGVYPESPDAYNLRGTCFLRQGAINDTLGMRLAIQDFNRAIQIDNKNPKYYNNLGWTFQLDDQYSEALSSFETARELDPAYISFHTSVLNAIYLMNKNDDALKMCDQLIQKFPNDGYAYYVRGQLKRDHLHKYLEGNKDIKIGEEKGWAQGVKLMY